MSARTTPRRVAGYTLFEALTMLAVTGLTVSAMLLVGMRGAATGLRLGTRAVNNADQQVSLQAMRDVFNSLMLPQLGVSSAASEAEADAQDAAGEGDIFEGEGLRLSAYIIATRDTPCATVGRQGRLTLTVSSESGRTQIACQLNSEDPVNLANLSWPDASFSYSEDGSTWTDRWTVTRGEEVEQSAQPDADLRKVFVRISGANGAAQMIALVTSGRPLAVTVVTQ